MTEPDIPHAHPHEHGASVGAVFSKKYAGLPGWAWGILIIGAIYAYQRYRNSQSASSASASAIDPNTGVPYQDELSTAASSDTGLEAVDPSTGETYASELSGLASAGGIGGTGPNSLASQGYTVFNPPPGTTYTYNNATGEIDQIWPDGTINKLSAEEYAALGKPAYTAFGTAPATTPSPTTPTPAKVAPFSSQTPGATVKASSSAPTKAVPVSTHEYTVVSGDTLSGIAERFYGNASDYTHIYDANKSVIGSNPNLIKPGQHLTIPVL